jgi:hypothetical protein
MEMRRHISRHYQISLKQTSLICYLQNLSLRCAWGMVGMNKTKKSKGKCFEAHHCIYLFEDKHSVPVSGAGQRPP